jgi:ATP-dependent Clp protease adaptor protein ClpS
MSADFDSEQQTLTKQKVAMPKLYAVVLLNDDFTPMDFVVELLRHLFGKSFDDAVALMMNIHKDGKGTAGIYNYEIAEQKRLEAIQLAKAEGHPLRAVVEEVG